MQQRMTIPLHAQQRNSTKEPLAEPQREHVIIKYNTAIGELCYVIEWNLSG